ncbi:TRP-like ion channel Pkd2, partial [Cymbomonas tetramitiformis]
MASRAAVHETLQAESIQEKHAEIEAEDFVPEQEDDEQTSSKVIQFLNEVYKERRSTRYSYADLLLFISYFVLYILVLFLQRSPGAEYKVREGIVEVLLPKDENGDPETSFTSHTEIYTWLKEQVVEEFWTEPVCGNNVCEDPLEFAAFGIYGCQTDCGVANTTTCNLILDTRLA